MAADLDGLAGLTAVDLASLDVPTPVVISDADAATIAGSIGLGEAALILETLGLDSLSALEQPQRLPLYTQLRVRQALLWVRVRRLASSPDPRLRALAATPFTETDSWLPSVLPQPQGRNGHAPPDPTLADSQGVRGSRRSRRKS
jgi:hypothetical protein